MTKQNADEMNINITQTRDLTMSHLTFADKDGATPNKCDWQEVS